VGYKNKNLKNLAGAVGAFAPGE